MQQGAQRLSSPVPEECNPSPHPAGGSGAISAFLSLRGEWRLAHRFSWWMHRHPKRAQLRPRSHSGHFTRRCSSAMPLLGVGFLACCAGGTGAGDSWNTPTLPSPSSSCSAHAATTSAGPRLLSRRRFPRPQQQIAASPPPCAARLTSPSAYFTPQPQNNGIRAFPSQPLQAEKSTKIAAVALETAPNLFRGRPRPAPPAPPGRGGSVEKEVRQEGPASQLHPPSTADPTGLPAAPAQL